MVKRKVSPLISAKQLLSDHQLYDQAVDIVSAFEWVYSESDKLPPTVRHFERFPNIEHPDGQPATPDFSVRFNDGSGLVGEIARFSLREESVDSLCSQIRRYDSLDALPTGLDASASVTHVDVLLFVPFELGTDAVRRILHDRMLDSEHPYSPSAAPCIIQFVADPDRYIFQRIGDTANGMPREGDRAADGAGIGAWLAQSQFKPRASGFAPVKSRRPFMNDPVPPLYLACYLWTRTLALRASGGQSVEGLAVFAVTADELARDLQRQTGVGRTNDVYKAMSVLTAARCAIELAPGRWGVAWGTIRRKLDEKDLSETLANRSEDPPAGGNVDRVKRAVRQQKLPDPFGGSPETVPGQLTLDWTTP